MIIAGSKKEVIKNIQKNILENELNKKVEVGDPILTDEEINKALNNFFENKKKKDLSREQVFLKINYFVLSAFVLLPNLLCEIFERTDISLFVECIVSGGVCCTEVSVYKPSFSYHIINL